MIQTLQKRLTTEEFRAWYPSNGKRYELIQGEIREVRPNGYHEAVAGFIGLELGIEARARKYSYTIPNTCAIEPVVTTGDRETLGTPETELHRKALAAFQDGDYQTVKRLASTHLSDYFCKALGYLGGALKLTPNTDTILAESARAAADFVKEKTLTRLGGAIEQALG
jgi:hypothetical protein